MVRKNLRSNCNKLLKFHSLNTFMNLHDERMLTDKKYKRAHKTLIKLMKALSNIKKLQPPILKLYMRLTWWRLSDPIKIIGSSPHMD